MEIPPPSYLSDDLVVPHPLLRSSSLDEISRLVTTTKELKVEDGKRSFSDGVREAEGKDESGGSEDGVIAGVEFIFW